MNFAIALTAFGLLVFLRKKGAGSGGGLRRGAGSGGGWKQWVQAGLAAIGGASLAETGIGIWLSERLSDAGALVGSVFDSSGGLVVGVAMVITTVVVVWDIGVDRVVNQPALVGLIVLPLLFLAAVGPLAAAGSGLTDSIAQAAAGSLGQLIGG
jgi:hypothetical protein